MTERSGTAASVGSLLRDGAEALRRAGLDDPHLEARLLLAYALRTTQEALLGDRGAAIPAEARLRFNQALKERCKRKPIAHVIGRQGFWTLDLIASPAALIPRADSETVVEAALELFPERQARLRVLDLGTGSGCLLLAVLAERVHASGIGVDSSFEAAALAALNARRNGLADRAAFVVGDWGDALAGVFDLVLSNPPYIETAGLADLMPEVVGHEPRLALDGGPDGLMAYRRVLRLLPRLLRSGGAAVLELGVGQRAAVERLVTAEGLALAGCHADLAGIDRALVVRATADAESKKAIGEEAEED